MGMADQIAVMSLGVLQQLATPDELYNRPENRFVANFIGSVLTNFLPVRYEEREGRALVSIAGAEERPLDVSDRKAAIESRADTSTGLTVAIRPERVRIVPPDSEEATLRARVVLVEPLGAKDVVHLAYDGQDLRAVGVPGSRPSIGENLGIALDPATAHLFDDESGLALR